MIRSAFLLLLLLPASVCAQPRSAELARAIPLVEAGHLAEAKPLLDAALRTNPNDAEALQYRGQVAFGQGQYSAAVEWLEHAAKLTPTRSAVQMWLGRAYGLQARDASVFRQPFLAKKTQAAMERAVQLDPNNVEARSDLIQYYLLAPSFMGGSVEKAKVQAKAIAARDSKQGHLAMAQIAFYGKDMPTVERELTAALAAAPGDIDTRIRLASMYLTDKRFADAWRLLDAGVALAPNDRTLNYQIGRAAAISGQQLDRGATALAHYLSGGTPLAGEPPFAAAHWRLGMIHEAQHNLAAAKSDYAAAVRLDPKQADAKAALARLQ